MILSKEEIELIKKRADAATPGPWLKGSWSGRCFENHVHGRGSCNYKYTLRTDEPCISLNKDNVTLIGWDKHGTVLNDKNATFIAASRTDIPSLIESHKALNELNFNMSAEISYQDIQIKQLKDKLDIAIKSIESIPNSPTIAYARKTAFVALERIKKELE